MSGYIAYRYRVYPTAEPERVLRRWAGCARAVWNAGLEQRQAAWRMNHLSLGYPHQGGTELSEAKRELPWLAEPHSDVLQQTLRDLDRAFRGFFRGETRYPRYRRKGRERFRIQSRPGRGEVVVRRHSRRSGAIRVPKLGWVRIRWTRRPKGLIKHMTVSCDALVWHVSLLCQRPVRAPVSHVGPAAGLDRGVATTVALSNGQLHTCPQLPPNQAKRLRRLMRKAGRQESLRRRRPTGDRERSGRHRRTLEQIARLRAREARIRTDFLHKVSHDIAKNHGVVVIEKLDIVGMTRSARGTVKEPGRGVKAKSGLNRAIRAQGWGKLRRFLAYKLEREGGILIEVPPAYTSQRCARCGITDSRSRQTQAEFLCVGCGHAAHGDVNAAQNILAAGLGRDSAVSPLQKQGTEPRTTPQGTATCAA